MKLLVRKKAYKLALLCTAGLSMHFMQAEGQPTPNESKQESKQDYTAPIDLMKDFLDTKKKPEAKIGYWVTQFLLLFQKDPKLKEFCNELKKAAHYKNPNPTRIGTLFLLHKEQFAKELRDHLTAKGVPAVKKILEERTKPGLLNS